MSALVGYKDKNRGPGLAFPGRKAEATDQAILEFESPSAAVIATPPIRFTRGVAWIISALVLSIIAVSGVIPIDIVVTGTGKVVSTAPTILVQPLDQAIVRSIDVHVGQQVHAGDLLARLDPTLAVADMKALQQQVDGYQAQIDRDKAEAEGKPYVSKPNDPASQLQAALYAQNMADRNFKLEGYRQQISSLELQVQRDLAQASYYRQRLEVAGDLQGMRLELQRLLVGSKLDTLMAIDNRLEMTRYMAQIAATAESEKSSLQNLVAQREAYDKEWYAGVLADMQQVQPQLDQARGNLKKAQLHAKLVELRADQDATVMSVALVSVGAVVQPGAQLITLVPVNAPLEVEADVLGRDAGYVQQNNSAVIKFDGFPYNIYGYAEGTVRVVGADSLIQLSSGAMASDPSVTNSATPNGSVVINGPTDAVPGATVFYQDRISLDKVKLHNLPHGFHIAPGMPVSIDIKCGKRTVLAYLLARVLPPFHEGMREP